MKKVAVIGSGVAGLACGVALKEKGIDVTILEKASVPGGKILTEVAGDFVVEAGPDSYLPEKYWSVQLVKKVGLEQEMLCTNDEFKGTFLYSKGGLHPLPEGVMLMVPTMIMPLLRSTLISWPGKIRMGMELFISQKNDSRDESLADFVTRRLGRECLEKIAEPLVAGIHTSNPDNMSVLATFPRFVDMEKRYGSLIKGMVQALKNAPPKKPDAPKTTFFMSLNGGMQQLVDACIKFIGTGNVHYNADVTAVNKYSAGYAVVLRDGVTQSFDAVVMATPSYVTKNLIRELDPRLADDLSTIAWSSSATINLAYKKQDIKRPLPGFGFIVPRVEKRRINACTWSSVKWSRRAPDDHYLIRSFVGGGHHEEIAFFPEEEIVSIVRSELKDIAGIDAEPVFAKVYRWNDGMPKYTVGHLDRIAGIDSLVKKYSGLYLIGCSYKGIGIGDCVRSGFEAADGIERIFQQ